MKRIKQKVLRVISVNLIWALIVAFTAAPAGAAVKAEFTTPVSLYTDCDNFIQCCDTASLEGAEKTIVTTVDDDAAFETNTVLVTIKRAYGEINKAYTSGDFSEIGCTAVEDLTALSEDVGELDYLNFEEFHQILLLTLAQSSRENVVAAIRTLERREDVLCAEPNYMDIVVPSAVPNDTYYLNSAGSRQGALCGTVPDCTGWYKQNQSPAAGRRRL